MSSIALLAKRDRVLACPVCHSSQCPANESESALRCGRCGVEYALSDDRPVMLRPDSAVHEWFDPQSRSGRKHHGFRRTLLNIFLALKPAQRVWTRVSKATIREMLSEINPDAPETVAVLIGVGHEPVYRRLLSPYKSLLRVGLPLKGNADIYCDICELAIADNSLDLIFSSSVLEHVHNPERAVAEMHRVLKDGGYVYAEIPFMRAYHMAPVDYQRYTYAGIEALFARHGFEMKTKGVCSGPFNATVLFLLDFISAVTSWARPVKGIALLVTGWILHPIKYLDLLIEGSNWSRVAACNFYYLGVKKTVQP